MVNMKALKLTFDLSDKPNLVELLKMHGAQAKKTQKEIVVKALEAYFADKIDSKLILKAAEKSFAEWDNPEDEIYNNI